MDSATWTLSSLSDFVIREGFWLHPLVFRADSFSACEHTSTVA
jgi:hypothetical protein